MGSIIIPETSRENLTQFNAWDDLHCNFQASCLSLIRFAYGVMVVLLSLVLRNLFPDPDVVCATLELRQPDAINWLSTVIIECLKDTIVDEGKHKMAQTRTDLVMCLRKVDFQADFTRVVDPNPDDNLKTLTEMIPDWNNIPGGGASFIQTVRAKFMYQYKALQSINFEHNRMEPNIGRTINPEFINEVTFGRGILVHDDGTRAMHEGLSNLPQFEGKIFDMDNSDLSFQYLKAQCVKTKQSIVPGIIEWGRHNPLKIAQLLNTLNDKDLNSMTYQFWIQKTYVYERLRLMHMHLFNENAPVVHSIAKVIFEKYVRVRRQEADSRTRQMETLKNRVAREHLYDAHRQRSISGSSISTGAQQRIYGQIPGDNHERNRKVKAAKKRKMQSLKNMVTYIPQNQWKALGERNERPFKSCKQAINDDCEEQEVVREAYDHRYLDGPSSVAGVSGYSVQFGKERSEQEEDPNKLEHSRIAALFEEA